MVDEAKKAPDESLRKEVKCAACGAPIPYLEGEAVLTCDYCGGSLILHGMDKVIPVERHLMVRNRFPQKALEKNIRAWMAEGFFKAEDYDERARRVKAEGVYLPFWVVSATGKSFWSGMDRRTRSRGSGKNRRTETYYVPENGEFELPHQWKVYARRNESRFGLTSLNKGGKATVPDWGGFWLSLNFGESEGGGTDFLSVSEPFTMEAVTEKMAITNGQITQEQAEAEARDEILEFHRGIAHKKTDKLMSCQTTVDITETALVHVPLWWFTYDYYGKKYQLLLNGHSGQVVKGEAPVGEYDKVVLSAGGAGVLTLIAILLLIFFPPGGLIAAGVAALSWLGAGIHFLIAKSKVSKRKRG